MQTRNDLPPALPLGLPGVGTDDNPYRLKKSQIGVYKPTTTTPFSAPTPFMNPGVQPNPYTAPPPVPPVQQQIPTQPGNTPYMVVLTEWQLYFTDSLSQEI